MEKNISKTRSFSAVDEGLRQYMIKVYNFMAGGLCVTALAAYLTVNTPLLRMFFSPTPQGMMMNGLGWIALFAPLALVFVFNGLIAKGTPKQVQIAFWVFSAVMGISIAPILLVYTQDSIARIFLITAAMFGGLSIYGYTTKKDLTGIGSFMYMGVIGLVIASIVNIFMQSSALYYAMSYIAVVVFTVLTAYDTQKIRDMYSSYDESDNITKKAIAGALSLYLDFINLFLALLRLFGDRR
ncbi:MAG: Bax inhibitor-1/YccA family protein [Lactobacillus sp.]|jgi:FtsH-binding integral membrane protein|nr:Bax inhibitor-1/YccA family protein [Lactobacillus sp.]